MDAEPPMRHRDVTSVAPGKSSQRAVERLLRGRLSLVTLFARAKKVTRQKGATPTIKLFRNARQHSGFKNQKPSASD
ncbi:hypothetical protein [Marinobacterium sedimentorum]|uniref:hypothetical protein n=1 Tax=Marinobacterium sedimentorum TaxID=2927804 RepID=UPI0020C71087|nr:hypothetical protein [Marinobacterium sedimentorum]MCP8688765.1 hypothetical protein [Marinobacterium sedimentorum]